MARRYTRDNRGRFASVGATARGGRLRTAAGNKRDTQTKAISGGKPGSTIGKPAGLKPQAALSSRMKMRDPNSALGKIAQRREQRQFMQRMADKVATTPPKQQRRLPLPKGAMKGTEAMKTHALITHAGQRKAARAQSKALQAAANANPLAGASAKLKARLATAQGGAQRAAARAQYKSAVRRAIKADRASIVPPMPAKPKRVALQRPAGTMAKPKTTGNSKAVVASRVDRKLAASKATMAGITRPGNVVNQRQYERQLKRGWTLERAQNYLKTGKLPGKDNSIAKQREMTAAKARLQQTNAARTATQSKAAKDIAAAQQRLKNKRYGDTANQYQNLVMDRKVASMTPAQLGASRVRSARAMVQRGQRSLRDPINADAPVSWRTRMERSIADSRREFRAAAADYRLIKPRRSRK